MRSPSVRTTYFETTQTSTLDRLQTGTPPSLGPLAYVPTQACVGTSAQTSSRRTLRPTPALLETIHESLPLPHTYLDPPSFTPLGRRRSTTFRRPLRSSGARRPTPGTGEYDRWRPGGRRVGPVAVEDLKVREFRVGDGPRVGTNVSMGRNFPCDPWVRPAVSHVSNWTLTISSVPLNPFPTGHTHNTPRPTEVSLPLPPSDSDGLFSLPVPGSYTVCRPPGYPQSPPLPRPDPRLPTSRARVLALAKVDDSEPLPRGTLSE